MNGSSIANRPASKYKPDRLNSQFPRWAFLVATAFHVGRLKVGAGTWGAAFGTILWVVAVWFVPPVWHVQTAIGVALLVAAIGIPAATLVARGTGEADPSYVIIDEVAGQIFALIGCPTNWKAVIASFVLFRIFDITKPFPLRRLERLPEGFGIMMDDVGAGLYTLIVLHVLVHFGIAR